MVNSHRKIELLQPLVGLPLAGIACRLGHILARTLDTGANVGDSITKRLAHVTSDCVDRFSQATGGSACRLKG